MNKCFAYVETVRNGIRMNGCDCLSRDAFLKVQKKSGKCCAKNCRFFKQTTDQVRTDRGIFYLTAKQKRIQREMER